jgi:hypothetical protein
MRGGHVRKYATPSGYPQFNKIGTKLPEVNASHAAARGCAQPK